ncbi:hypothetical protein RIF29_24063 [Crotalaria pallida]|uniref:Uncharacterized protein n=1 Tax=Crotalaria pallida TaxID=3830 RepID=A0AAN9EJU9_CROPI
MYLASNRYRICFVDAKIERSSSPRLSEPNRRSSRKKFRIGFNRINRLSRKEKMVRRRRRRELRRRSGGWRGRGGQRRSYNLLFLFLFRLIALLQAQLPSSITQDTLNYKRDAADAAAKAKAKDVESSETGGGGVAESETAVEIKALSHPCSAEVEIVLLRLRLQLMLLQITSSLATVEEDKAANLAADKLLEFGFPGIDGKLHNHVANTLLEFDLKAGDQTGVKRKTGDYLCGEKEIQGPDCCS